MTGLLIGLNGPPKTGKSHMARSAAALGKTAVALTDPDEAEFYREAKLEPSIFFDEDWRPQEGRYEATGFQQYMKWLGEREKDDSQFVITDTGNGVSDLALHLNLKAHQTDNPKDAPYGAGYTGHDRLLLQAIQRWKILVLRGKTVLVTWHVKMKEQEGVGEAKDVKQMDGTVEKEFDEQLLPAIPTSFRQVIPGHFPVWLFTKPAGFGKGRQYLVTAQADQVRPAACRFALSFADPMQSAGRFPNDLKTLLAALGRTV